MKGVTVAVLLWELPDSTPEGNRLIDGWLGTPFWMVPGNDCVYPIFHFASARRLRADDIQRIEIYALCFEEIRH